MNGDICGHCEHFTLVDAPRAAAGEGRCTIYGPKNPEPFVQWDHPPTVLFWPVKIGLRVTSGSGGFSKCRPGNQQMMLRRPHQPGRQATHATVWLHRLIRSKTKRAKRLKSKKYEK